jgi:Trypsin-like peptidase domain
VVINRSHILVVIILVLLASTLTTKALALSDSEVFGRYAQAIVKITVTGKDTENLEKRPAEGSGVIVYSDKFTLVLTAAHVIGSNSLTENRDWAVGNGEIKRKIRVESLDAKGVLTPINDDAKVLPVVLPPGIDIVVLSMPQHGYTTVPLPSTALNFGTSYDVLLTGFRGGERDLSLPWQGGRGVPKPSGVFITEKGSRTGESGGPWIDWRTGLLLAIASGSVTSNDQPEFVSAYVPLAVGQLKDLIKVSSSDKDSNPEPLPPEKRPDANLPDRNQWTRSYLQPPPGVLGVISGDRYGVVVGSYGKWAAARTALGNFCKRFPLINFALLGSTSATQEGGYFQIEIGYNLTKSNADSLTALARRQGVANDAFARRYGWTAKPENFSDCIDLDRFAPKINISHNSVTFIVSNSTVQDPLIAFYSQTRGTIWPGLDRSWILRSGQSQNRLPLSCVAGDQICYGAWVRGSDIYNPYHWGVGRFNNYTCQACCYSCDGNTYSIPLGF